MILIGRSDFSIGESILKMTDFVESAKLGGHEVLALADTMTVSGIVEFTRLCDKNEIRPIVGCRLRVLEEPLTRYGKAKAPKQFFPMIWPKNQAGFQKILEMLTLATDADHFYYAPRLCLDEVIEYVKSGDLLLSTGDIQSMAENRAMMTRCATELTADFWGQFNLHSGAFFNALNTRLKEFPICTKQAMVTRPVLYPEGKHEALDTMSSISRRATVSQMWRNVIAYHDLHPVSLSSYPKRTAADLNWLAEVSYKFEPLEISLPDMSQPGKTEKELLIEMCAAGWNKRLKRDVLGYQPTAASHEEYLARLRFELGTISEMGFERYFLLVEDLVRWAKENGVMVGPGRGSVGGSLVAYLLGITDVDPIRFGLLFERFINPDRLDLPDADLDFQSSRRHEVIQYLKDRYGSDKVAGIVNFNSINSKGALRDVGRVFEIPPKVLFISKLVPEEYGTSHSLEMAREEVAGIDDFANKNPDAWRNACDLQGVQRALGRHAAGVIVAGEPLVNRAVIDYSKDEPAVGWDKRTVEDMGLVKMDILGLSNLDVLELAQTYIKETTGEDLDLYNIPLDDAKTLEAFALGQTAGVFQFESAGMRKLLTDLSLGSEKMTFESLTAATSLYRPGPKDSGLLDDYVAIKQGLKTPMYEHPALERALHETQGVVVYQEQVSKIASYLCGFSGAEADHIRKAMGKKDPIAMAKWRDRFVEGAKTTSEFPETRAASLFSQIEAFAGYAFNKSHAVEYTVISFWTMWLKVHHPAAFFAATLTVLKEEKLEGLVRDAQRFGLSIVPPDINLSTDRFEINEKELIAPFNRVKQISDKTAKHVMEVRQDGPFANMDEVLERTTGRTFNVRHRGNLEKVGAFASIDPDAAPPLDESRLKDQMELMPGLIISVIKADREIAVDTKTKNRLINEVVRPCAECKGCDLAGEVHPLPRLGGKASFMVVTDCPNFSEVADNKMLSGKAANYVREALAANDIQIGQGYFTSLVKAPKRDKMLSNEQINGCKEWLNKEIEILNPPVIVMLGNSVIKHLAPEIKPGMENAGRIIYRPELDASLVVGFNPASITFDSSKQNNLNEIFERVKESIG